MGGSPLHEQTAWRYELERLIKEKAPDKSVIFVHPPDYYNYDTQKHKTENEERVWALSQLKDSDIVVVNLSNISSSIGTIMELATADAMNQFGYKHIHVVGVGKPETDHPWISSSLLRQEDDLRDAADYITEYLLI